MRNPLSLMPHEGDASIPKEIYGWRPYALAFSAAWAAAAFGYDSAFIGGTLNLVSFQHTYGLDTKAASELAALSSNIVSTFQGGAFFGSIGGFFAGERFGRKPIVMASMVIFMLGVVLQLIGQIGLLYAGRILTGVGVGGSMVLLPIFIAECSPALIRGRLVGIFEVMVQIAIVCGFWVNYGVAQNMSPTDPAQWRVPVAVQFIPSGLLLICMPFLIESPRWLVSKDQISKARASLSWVRGLPEDHPFVVAELGEIQASVTQEIEYAGGRGKMQLLKELFAPGVRNRVIISVMLMLLQNLTGINAINYYSSTLLKAVGYSGQQVQLLATGVYGIIKMLSTVVFMFFLVDRFGRRPALLIGATGAAIAMFYLAGYSKMSGSFSGTAAQDGGSRAALAMVYLFIIFHSASWTGIPWIFSAEVMPTRVRTLGMMFPTCMQWLAQFIVVYSLPYMINSIKYGTFIFYGTCTVVAGVFAFLFVPETRGVALEDMDLLFGVEAPVYAPAARKRYLDAKDAGLTSVTMRQVQKGDVHVEEHEDV